MHVELREDLTAFAGRKTERSCNPTFPARDGRTLADVLLSDGTNVNHMLVKQGWCWWYRKYAPEDVMLAELETRARAKGLGL